MIWHKACAIWVRSGARWLHTCRGPVSSYRITNAHLRSSSQDSASPSRRCGSLTKSLRMSRRGMGGKRLCKARASRGGAHGRAWVRVRANSRAVQGSWCAHAAVDHRELLEIDGDGRRTERFFRPLWQGSRVFQFSFFGKTAAWGRLVGRQRVQKRSQNRKKRSF